MKLIFKDVISLSIIFSIWSVLYYLTYSKTCPFHEALRYFPLHFIISIGYYAVLKVCYNILSIKDCTKEYNTLLKEIDEARDYYTKQGIKYN
jgi:hypothetical protein